MCHWSAASEMRPWHNRRTTTAVMMFQAMMTYGQFVWYEPLRIALMTMQMDGVVVVEDECGWLVEMTVGGCKWKGRRWAVGRYL
jgi:hypothetical protein